MATEKTTTKDIQDAASNGRVFRGVVVSDKMQDTIAVLVDRYVKHPKYKKYLRRSKKFLVHDAGNTAKVGDTVEIREIRPLSKRKHFTLVK
ncbi:30S ribosomal protein S17 [Candidatus Kaiserbacteria bacterium]|nr:30S ribosomal protein S17 [Candidatus Kaiserbacteria bacterium]